jgi:LemA protein
MQDYNEQKFQETIKSIVEATEEQEDRALTIDELKELAISMGMTGEEWEKLLLKANDDLKTAELHLNARNYVDAISFADKATAINPYLKNGNSVLAQSYLMQWLDDGDTNKRDKAEFYARKELKNDPNDKRAVNVLSTIQNKKRIAGGDQKLKKYVLIGVVVLFLFGLIGFFSMSGNSSETYGSGNVENQLIENEELANQKWGDVQSALDRRDQLIPDLLLALGEANDDLNTHITQLREEIKSADGQKKIDLEKQLEDKIAEAKLYLKNGPTKSDIIIEIEGAENRINFARKEYNKAVKDYNILVKKNKSDYPNYELKPYFE